MGTDETTIDVVERRIGYEFKDRALLATALTHSSYASERDVDSYERLEFLGDAILGMAVTVEIYLAREDAPEGDMTRIRASIVDETTLASVARVIGLSEAVQLGVGEERGGGRQRSSTLADIVESIIGAVYVDGGVDAAFGVVERLMGDAINRSLDSLGVKDSRSKLQERLGKTGRSVVFTYEQSGPDHDPVFTAAAVVDEVDAGSGSGRSKKAAAIAAARDVLDSMDL